MGVDWHASMEIDLVTGTLCFKKITYNNIIHENSFTGQYDINKTWDYHTAVTYTNTHATSTSISPTLVGRDGDVFIGYSTNYIIGAADKVGVMRGPDGEWVINKTETITMDEKFNTHFKYTQSYIENTLFNNVRRTRDAMLVHITDMSEIQDNPPVATYYTTLSPGDARFGSDNDDKELWGNDAKPGFEGPSYYARFPDGYEGCDSVRWCNEIIKLWEKTLADNEEDKLKAFNDPKMKVGNESFERGVTVTNSAARKTDDVKNSVEAFTTKLAYKGKNGYLLDKFGIIFISNVNIGYHRTHYSVDQTTTSQSFSYSLNDNQRGCAHSVDIFNSPRGWSPIFRTRGGQTRCPYEGERVTKYYNPGTVLDYATMRCDNPHIEMPVRNIVDVPSGQTANLQIMLTNDSETHDHLTSVVIYVGPASNPTGLQLTLDGDAMTEAHEVWLEYGKPLVKTIQVKQSDPSILDYNDVKIQLLSSCDYAFDPASSIMGRTEYDKSTFSIHFVPSAPAVTLKVDKNVLNGSDVSGGNQVKATISNINRLFTGFKGVRLKYRFAGDSQWITAHEWIKDEKYLADGKESETQTLLSNDEPDIHYNLVLPDIDGTYTVVAESMCVYGNKEVVSTTAEQTVLRDTRGPKLLGQAYPNTGRLMPGDDIRIKFNEDIRESYLNKETNFYITGQLNDSKVDREVALQLNGASVSTEAYMAIDNSELSASLWLKRKSAGTILEHGTDGNKLQISINEQGQAVVDINGTTVTSQEVLPLDKWVFLALSFKAASNPFKIGLSMLMAEGSSETLLFDAAEVPHYTGSGRLTLGGAFTGKMQELTLWNKDVSVRTLLGQKDEAKAAYMPGLVGYWKMNEGHGKVVTDYARARNILLPTESWAIDNSNLAAHLDGARMIKIPIGDVAPRPTDSYVVETWFRGEKDKNAGATLLSITDCLSIGFDASGAMTLKVYNDTLPSLLTSGIATVLTDVDHNDGQWHHLALNVRRGTGATLYIDGNAVKALPERLLPAPAGDQLNVGGILKRNTQELIEEKEYFTGDIDEVRLWNIAIDGTSIAAGRYNQVDTSSTAGLMAYYPMERRSLDANGNIVVEFSLANNAPGFHPSGSTAASGEGVTVAATAPPLRKAPLKQNLDFDYTASANEIFINLNTPASRMHGNLLTFVVKNVRDLRDNLSEPITWSAQVDYGTLEWSYEGGAIEKDRLSTFSASARLRNKGRSGSRFTIEGLPGWVRPSVERGVLGVDEAINVTFTIGDDAPVGTHHINAYAVNDDGITAPLSLEVAVVGNIPQWSVDPRRFESSMNIVGQIYLDSRICANRNSMIAAFVGDECRGVASPAAVTSRDAYYVNLTVYGAENVTRQEPIIFRIYDAEHGVVLPQVTTTLDGKPLQLNYRPNQMVGDFDTPAIWTATTSIEQQCDFEAGWNWISLHVKPDEGSDGLEDVFGTYKVFNTVKGKQGFAMNSGTKWVSTGLETLDVGNLYKVKVLSDVTLNVTGAAVDPRVAAATIYPGWNWIGPISLYNLSVAEAFADLNPTRGDIVKNKSQVAIYDGYKWEGDLTALIPGMGYYYKSQAADAVTFHYPTVDATAYLAPSLAPRAARELPFTPVDHHSFSDNMNVVAQVVKGVEPLTSLCLGAFIDGECRGVATATAEGLYLLTISGNAEEAGKQVEFATVYNGEEVRFDERLPWGSDVIYGDLDTPQVFHLTASGIDDTGARAGITISPAIVTDVVNVEAGDLLKTVNVYAVSGSLLERLTPDDNHVALNLSHLPAGVYFVEAVTHSGVRATKRIVKSSF